MSQHTERYQGEKVWPIAVRSDHLIFFSGQTAVRKSTGGLVLGWSDVEHEAPRLGDRNQLVASLEDATGAQIWTVYSQLAEALEQVGSSLKQIVLMNGWYADFSQWPVMDRLRRLFFDSSHYPVSTGFGARSLGSAAQRAMYEILAVPDGEPRDVVGSPIQVGSYTAGSRIRELVFLAGEIPGDPATGLVVRSPADLGVAEELVRTGILGLDGWEGRMRAQTWFVYERIRATLADAGSDLSRIAKQNVYLRDLRDVPAFVHMSEQILGDTRPATTIINVDQYGHPGFDLEVEVVAVTEGADPPSAIGRHGIDYPAAVQAGSLVFLSGLAAPQARPENGFRGRDVEAAAQTASIFDQAAAILSDCGLDLSALLRQVVYVTDPNVTPIVESVAAERTRGAAPATTIVGVGEIVPRGALVQIDFTARRRG